MKITCSYHQCGRTGAHISLNPQIETQETGGVNYVETAGDAKEAFMNGTKKKLYLLPVSKRLLFPK